jgi:hypothetical protein
LTDVLWTAKIKIKEKKMDLEQIFSLCSAIAMIGWAGLVLAPRWTVTRDLAAPIIAPLLIGLCYAWLMLTNFSSSPAEGNFNSLAGVTAMFTVPELVLAGWIHYLAFDLFVGAWEVKDGQAHNVPHWLIVPCLLVTLMAGPAGLVLYWVVKMSYLRMTVKTAVA